MAKTDASTKILGFKYQEMVALLRCFEAKEHSTIYIECYGDVADGKTSIEVKSSIDEDKVLHNTHIDFWKTLSNLVDEKIQFKDYSHFILHTTATIKKASIFDGWAKLKPKEKLDKVIAITPNATIQKYYNTVKACDNKDLLKILERLEIHDNQPKVREFYKDQLIKNDTIVNATEEKNREPIIERLLGHISSILVKSEADNYKWKIDVENDFRVIFRTELKKYQIDDLLFPLVKIEKDELPDTEFKFTKELKEIDYDTKIGAAMLDYLRAEESRIKMIKARSNLSEHLDVYDEDIKEQIGDLKSTHVDIFKTNAGTDHKESSRRFYDQCLNEIKNKKEIDGVKNVKDYYPKGRVHFNVEEDDSLTWNLNTKDEGEGI